MLWENIMMFVDTVHRQDLTVLDDRCAPRVKLRIPATLRAPGQKPFSVIVVDLSVAGFACEAVSGIPKGSICWLTLPGLTGLQSEVMWNTSLHIGCAFSNLLNAAVLDMIITRHKTSY